MTFKLPSLSYEYDSLEPFLDKETMEIHHTKHHQTYINNSNKILEDLKEFSNLSEETLILRLNDIPLKNRMSFRNNLGGHINHSIFWKILGNHGTNLSDDLKNDIEFNFKSIPLFKEEFEKVAAGLFGSGWVWLIEKNKRLSIVSTKNQDNPLMDQTVSSISSSYPIFGIDVWEHAYYLKYQNRRLEYIKSIWNILNWDEISNRYKNRYLI